MVVTAGAEAKSAALANHVDPSALVTIASAQDSLDQLGNTLADKMSELHKLQDSFEASVKKQAKMIKAVTGTRRAQAAQKTARRLSSRGETDGNSSSSTENEEAEFGLKLDNLSGRLRERQLQMPCTGGMFVEMFLGSINVRFPRKSERLAFKSEYERVKLKFAPVGVVICIICLLLPEYRWLHMMFQLFVSCHYVTLAIRENILRVNGSNIRGWWIIHHYFTMMQSVLLLTWPNGASYARVCNRLHAFGLFNGLLMIFQTRYQMARLYALRSLGRANEMDVASSDNSQIHWSETMTLLLPLVVLGQLFQGYMSAFLYSLYRVFSHELQILFLCILFTANFIGNVFTTVQVILAKRRGGRRAMNSGRSAAMSSSSTDTSRVKTS